MNSSSFSEVLQNLIDQQGTLHAGASSLPHVSRRHLPGLECLEAVNLARHAARCYSNAADAWQADETRPCELDIGQALNLSDDLTPAEIQAIRRRFAKGNHPDLFDSAYQNVALHRMQIANDLIDRALARYRDKAPN